MAGADATSQVQGLVIICLVALAAGMSRDSLAQDAPVDEEAPLPAIPVQAEDPVEPPAQLDLVEVTGSRILRSDYETAQPVFSIDKADIERSGKTSIAEILQDMTIAGSAASDAQGSSATGSREVDLRNLGSQRVLVLVNGRRWVGGMYFYGTGSVDLGTIPLSIIERVDVLKDGASAIYGSDAVAGVVNIITRKDYVGAELSAYGASYANGTGRSQSFNLSWGGMRGGTSLFLDASYVEDGNIPNTANAVTRYPRVGVSSTRGSYVTDRGTLLFAPTPENAGILGEELCPVQLVGTPVAPNVPVLPAYTCFMILQRGQTITGAPTETSATVASRYEPFNDLSMDESVNDQTNFNPFFDFSNPSERASLFGTLSHAFGDGLSLQGEFLYTRRQQVLPTLVAANFGDWYGGRVVPYLAADHPFNPFDQDIGRGDAQGFGGGLIYRWISEMAPQYRYTVESWRAGMGVNGDVDAWGRMFRWQAGVVLARSKNKDASSPSTRDDHLALALGPTADCTAAPGCLPVNVLGGPGTLTPAMIDYITYQSSYPKEGSLDNAYLGASNDLFTLPAGAVTAAYGLEYRKEGYADFPDALTVACVGASCFPPTRGSFNLTEAFVEFSVPLLADRPFAEALDLSLASRYSRYNTFGGATTYKGGMRWKPVDSLLVRATASTAFRAPAISDLYLTPGDFPVPPFYLPDPCSDYAGAQGGPPASPVVQENCRNDGVPETYVQTADTHVHDGGNPLLQPETALALTGGFVYSPDVLPDFSAHLDWYRIELEDSITLLDAKFLLDFCYETPGGGQTCSQVIRDPATGTLTDVNAQPINIGGNTVEGVDVGLEYRLPPLWNLGSFKLRLDGAYLTEYSVRVAASGGEFLETGFQGRETGSNAYPRLKANATLLWTQGAWQASWVSRYVHHMVEACHDGGLPSLTELGLCSRPNAQDERLSENELRATVYHDVQVQYDMQDWGLRATLGARNVLDQAPPPSYSNFYNAFDAATHDLPGVYPYLRLSKSF